MAHPNDSQPHSRYEFLREIGRGTFGRVVLATDTFRGDRVAVKQIELSHLQDRELFRREIVALRLARLPGVVQLRDHFESPLPPSWSGGRANVPSVAPTRPLNSAQPTRGSDRRAFAFIVMDFVPGVWFGDNRRCTWDEISSPVSQLLINLTRLHIAKIIHRDIKPQNVLVHGDQPTLLDLGISGGHALRFLSGQEGATGTVRYAAPEGRRYGRWETRSDIFSVGAMIWGVLAGRLHLGEFSTAELLHPEKNDPPYEDLPASVYLPAHVRELLRAMLAPRPEDRPDGLAALLALGVPAPVFHPEKLHGFSDPADPQQLSGLFSEQNMFLHLHEDAGNALFCRTGGNLRRVSEELNGWVLANKARCVDDLLSVSRKDLHILQQGSPVLPPADGPSDPLLCVIRALFPHATRSRVAWVLGWAEEEVETKLTELRDSVWMLPDGTIGADLRHYSAEDVALLTGMANRLSAALPTQAAQHVHLLLELRRSEPAVVDEACRWMEHVVAEGDYNTAAATYEAVLDVARAHQDEHAVGRLLACVTEDVAARPLNDQLNDAHRLLLEANERVPGIATYRGIVTAADHWREGRYRQSFEVLATLEDSGFDRVEMTRMAMGAVVSTSARTGDTAAWLERWRSWAMQSPERAARWHMAMGRLQYSNEDFPDSASSFRLSAELEPTRVGTIRYTVDELSSRLEDNQLDVILERIPPVLDAARLHRETLSEIRLTHLQRAAAYRCGVEIAPEPRLITAAGEVAPRLAGLLATVDAAIHWRSGDTAACRAVATVGLAWLKQGVRNHIALLLRALLAATGSAADAQKVDDWCASLEAPGLIVQIAALLHAHHPSEGRRLRALAAASGFSAERRRPRREVLSIDECLALLGAAESPT